ncbi:MAG: glycosyltransferase family 2 protein [Burkholderiaceae bacterium]
MSSKPSVHTGPAEGVEPWPPSISTTHLVLIPSYDSGPLVLATVREARRQWLPVWIVFDGSTDGSDLDVQQAFADDPGVRVLALPVNRGKGAAVLHGLIAARDAGFTHALTMDADGQHPAQDIGRFMHASQERPEAMILGRPIFDADAPALRVKGRRISNWWTNLETLWTGVDDSLFGFRVYPIAPLLRIMQRQRWMRRFDFDVEAVVRLRWARVPAISLGTPVRYLSAAEGGVSHFKYVRDNALLSWMHARLMFGFAWRLPMLLWRKWTSSP